MVNIYIRIYIYSIRHAKTPMSSISDNPSLNSVKGRLGFDSPRKRGNIIGSGVGSSSSKSLRPSPGKS